MITYPSQSSQRPRDRSSLTIETNVIIQGDAHACLRHLPDASVDCVITSPPFWALRDYHVPGQLGQELTPDRYIDKLCRVFDEAKRVLKETGTCWVNLGDTYATRCKGDSAVANGSRHRRFLHAQATFPSRPVVSGAPRKSLCLIPFLFALGMVQRGWLCRNVIIWQKPNALPSSAGDRFTVDFEYLLFFTKSPRYWFELQYEPLHPSTQRRVARFRQHKEAFDPGRHKHEPGSNHSPFHILERISRNGLNPLGRQRRCVWRIPTHPFRGAHFATFPEELIETPIKAGCPELVCIQCGWPIGNTPEHHEEEFVRSIQTAPPRSGFRSNCGCRAGSKPGVVLDPFLGSGTTALVALKLKRHFIGIELNPDYVTLATKRLHAAGFRTVRPGRAA